MEDVDEDLLRRVDEAEQAAEHEGHGQHVADADAAGQRRPEGSQYACRLDRLAILGMLGLGQLQQDPDHHDGAETGQHAENPAPGRDPEDRLTDRGRQDRHGQEDDHGERHDTRHLAAGIAVAHDRNDEHAGGGGTDALHHARRHHRLEGACEGRGDAGDDIDRQAHEQDRTPAIAIRDRAVEDLRDPEAEQIGGDDPLPLVGLGDAE